MQVCIFYLFDKSACSYLHTCVMFVCDIVWRQLELHFLCAASGCAFFIRKVILWKECFVLLSVLQYVFWLFSEHQPSHQQATKRMISHRLSAKQKSWSVLNRKYHLQQTAFRKIMKKQCRFFIMQADNSIKQKTRRSELRRYGKRI